MAKKAGRRARTSKKKTTKKKTTKVSRKPRLSAISTTELQREIARRRRDISKLERKRDRLAEQLAEVEAEIKAAGGELGAYSGGAGGRSTGRKRPSNKVNLADSLVAVLKKPMGVTEAAEAVKAAGYQSNAANFRIIVNQTLLKDPRIEKVSRGVYQAKK